jgi:DNA-directed RNA polymerase subunit H (RpoH/RPB5)
MSNQPDLIQINIVNTLKEIFEQREYKLLEVDEDKIIGQKYGQKLCAFTNVVISFNVRRVKEYISVIHEMKINHCIIVHGSAITSMAKKMIENCVDVTIELFTSDELQYNPTKHVLVPKHVELSKEHSIEFKKKNGIKYGVILKNDPIVRFYNFQKGSVIEITRSSNFVTYKIVR